MKPRDNFVLIYLGIGFPVFVVVMVAILLTGAFSDHISFREAFEALQGIIPVFIAYVSAVLGFSFREHVRLAFGQSGGSSAASVQGVVRFWVSLCIPTALMAFDIVLSILLAVGKITLDDYKIAVAAVTWSLTGVVGYIVGKFFGESVSLTPPAASPPAEDKGTQVDKA